MTLGVSLPTILSLLKSITRPPSRTRTHTHIYIYIHTCIYIYSYCAISRDIPDTLLPHLPIVHCFRQILRATSRIGTELLYVRLELDVLPLLVHVKGSTRGTSLMSSSLLLQEYPTCLVRLILIVFVMGGRWPYTCCFVGCCL